MVKKEDKTIIVINLRASAVELPGELAKDGTPLHNGKMLLPGENDVNEEYWNRTCKNHHVVKMYMDSVPPILATKTGGKAKSLDKGLDSLEKHEALMKIAQCDEIKILSKWASNTENDSLKNACNKRIKEVEAMNREDEKDNE